MRWVRDRVEGPIRTHERERGVRVERPFGALSGLGVALGVLAGSTALAKGTVPSWEEEIFAVLNSAPASLEPVLWVPMQLGSLVAPFAIGAVAWRRWHRWRPSAGVVVGGVLAWELAKVIKHRVARARPFELVEDFARLSGTPYEGLGFVSGHSAVAFSTATILSPYLDRRTRVLAYTLAAAVGVARIHVSAHMPLDVVGGAALGYAVGAGWNLVVGIPGTASSDSASGLVDPGRSRSE